MEYPVDAVTDADKLEYCLLVKEFLKVFYNAFSKWASTGLTQVQYDKLPTVIKNKYPYVSILPTPTFKSFLNDDYEPREDIVKRQILLKRQALRDSERWTIVIGDIV